MELAEDRYVDPTVISIVYAGLKDTDSMLTFLEAGYKDRSPLLIYAMVFPDIFLMDLQSEPRFQALLENMQLD